jgi:hypothetical protein
VPPYNPSGNVPPYNNRPSYGKFGKLKMLNPSIVIKYEAHSLFFDYFL